MKIRSLGYKDFMNSIPIGFKQYLHTKWNVRPCDWYRLQTTNRLNKNHEYFVMIFNDNTRYMSMTIDSCKDKKTLMNRLHNQYNLKDIRLVDKNGKEYSVNIKDIELVEVNF